MNNPGSTDGLQQDKRVIVIGAGPGGICVGKMLLEAGFGNVTILEKAAAVGGVWQHNVYPGAACDVPSDLYCFSFAQDYEWTREYAGQEEIRDYLEWCVHRFGLTDHVRCSSEVTSIAWSDEDAHWTVQLVSGEQMTAEVVISAVGMFNLPYTPAIPGLGDFQGELFHAAKWPRDRAMDERRVAIIGSAASAIQIVPAIASATRLLHVFQRTPNWILPREDKVFGDQDLERRRTDRYGRRERRWKIWRDVVALSALDGPYCERAESVCRAHLNTVVDSDLRAKLTPTHPFGAKRPLISSDFYVALQRENVELVTEAIEQVTRDGVLTADGKLRHVNTIVMATGFQTTRFASVVDIQGVSGLKLSEAWADGAQAYLGIATSGFPNFFMLYGPNTNNGSIFFMLECQADYIVRQIVRMRGENIASLTVRGDIEARYNERLQRDLAVFKVWAEGVNSYYRAESGRLVTQCPYTLGEYRELTAHDDPEAYLATQAATSHALTATVL